MTIIYRRAGTEDVDDLCALIRGYADKGIMLPRSPEMIRSMLDTFAVAENDGRVVGCGSLCRLGDQLVEIRSLGIVDEYKGQGIGSRLVDFLVREAQAMKIRKVMALTYEVKFFERNGFKVMPKEVFPEKVWKDCVFCKKQHCCDEIAVLKTLE